MAARRLGELADEAGVYDRSRYMQQVLDEAIAHGWQGVFPAKEFADAPPPVHIGTARDMPRAIPAGADITQYL